MEIPLGQAKRLAFSQKFRLDKQNVARFHGNSSWASKTSHVFAENSFERAKRDTFSRKFHFGKENAARFYRKFVWTSKTSYVFMEIPLGQAKRRAFSQEFRLNERNATRFREKSILASKTWRIFRRNFVLARKTARGNACFLRGGRFRRAVEVKIYSADKTCLRFHGNALRKWARSVLAVWLPAGSQNDRRHDCRLRGFGSLNHRFP